MPKVIIIREARAQLKDLPRSIRRGFMETFPELEKSFGHHPSWIDCKSLGEIEGRAYWRVRIGDYRGTFTFDIEVIRFVRFRKRPPENYKGLPKL